MINAAYRMKQPVIFGLSILALAFVVGCSARVVDQAETEFQQAMDDLGLEAASMGKADFIGWLKDKTLCGTLNILSSAGEHTRSTLYFNGRAYLGGAVAQGFIGHDNVWDLFHHQATVSSYKGAGVGTNLGVELDAYAGFAFGAAQEASEWNGYFVSSDVDVKVPFLGKAGLTCFITGVDDNQNGIIGPTELRLPPQEIYGCALELSKTFGWSPIPLPVDVEFNEGQWRNNAQKTIKLADRDEDKLQATLVESASGDLYVQYGDESMTHLERGKLVAKSILRSIWYGVKDPLVGPSAALSSLAMGLWLDHGDELLENCVEPELTD